MMLRYSLLLMQQRSNFFNAVVRRTLFGKDTSAKQIKDDFDGGIIEPLDTTKQSLTPSVAELASYKTKKFVTRLVTCRPYAPPSNVEEIIFRIACETMDNFKQELRSKDNWQSVLLNNPLNKYNLLTRCMKECSHTISNMSLNDMKTLEDVYRYFSTPVKDTNVLEDLHQSADLPKNVHIQLDAVRFTPETSSFFNELDAFPKRSTKVIDLWYKKKYASYPKNEDDPFKDNIY